MDRERELQGRREEERSAPDIAGRLDRLSAEAAEDVIRRAIQLTDEEQEEYQYGTMDAATLEKVAAELGIPARHVQRALAEQRAGLHQPADVDTRLDRLFGIVDLDEAAIIEGSRHDVEEAVAAWMHNHEGMRVRRHSDEATVWMKDDRPLAAIRMGLGVTHGSKSLRTAGDVEHLVRSIGENEQLLSITASKHRLRTAAKLWLIGASLPVVAGVLAGITGGLEALIPMLAGGIALAGAIAGAAVAGVRGWAAKIRTAVERAVDAVTDPEGSGVFDTFPGRLGSFLKSIGLLPRQRGRGHHL